MTPALRIRLARRHGGLSQAALAAAVGVQRSAVSHWEGNPGKSPSAAHLREIGAFRDSPVRARAPLVEVVEQLAQRRVGRPRNT